MAFDVYVGSLTRYFRRDWENVAQKMARQQGMKYTMIHAGGEPTPPQELHVVQTAVLNWCDYLQKSLANDISTSLRWNESHEAPYFTDRPGWEGYRGLLLVAAYAEHPELTRPETLPDEWCSDKAFIASADHNFPSKFSQLLTPQLWLPVNFDFIFDAPTLARLKERIGSTFELRRQLLALEISSTKSQAPPEAGDPPDSPNQSLIIAGQAGLDVFLRLSKNACESNLPMLLNF